MGALPPQYSFFLNPHANEAFTRCPRCKAKTRVRKMALVVHVDSVGFVLLRKTCRLCVVCEMLIAHEGEMDRLIDSLRNHRVGGRKYLVLGTLESKTWRQSFSGSVTIDEVVGAMADFKAHMRVDITPRHWSRRNETTD
jgi:MinD superfamily P-loop ATPase